MVVEVAVSVVRNAFELAVELAGHAIGRVGGGLVDVALVGGHIAAAGVLVRSRTSMARRGRRPVDCAPARDRDDGGRPVEQDGLEVGVAHPPQELARGDDGAVREFAEL